MIVKLKYSQIKPQWNWGGFLPHINDFNKVFSNEKEFNLKYNPDKNSIELFMDKDELKNINLIFSNSQLDMGPKIFFKDKIIQTTYPKVKVLFTWDIKYTFYYIFSQENLNTIKIWTKRNCLPSYQYIDDYLTIDMKNDFKVVGEKLEQNFIYSTLKNKPNTINERYRIAKGDVGADVSVFYIDTYYTGHTDPFNGDMNPCLYFIFTKAWNANERPQFLALPVLAQNYLGYPSSDATKFDSKYIALSPHKNTLDDYSFADAKPCYNDWATLDKLYRTKFANNFMGVFWGPPLYTLKDTNRDYIASIKSERLDGIDKTFLVLTLNERGMDYQCKTKIYSESYDGSDENVDEYAKNMIYLLNNRDIYYYNNNLKGKNLISYQYLPTSKTLNYYLDFNGVLSFGGNFSLSLNFNTLEQQKMIISYPSFINFMTDEYAHYIQANNNQMNTSLQIAKQQSIVGGVLGTIGLGASMLFPSPFTAVGAVNQISNSIFGYSREKQKIQATLADKKESAKNEIISSTEESNSLLSYMVYPLRGTTIPSTRIQINNIETVKEKINDIIYQYGYYNPDYINFKNINELNKDFSIEMDQQDLSYKISQILSEQYDNELIVNPSIIDSIVDAFSILRVKKEGTSE